jgi:SAM-dependent methyltransferase
MRIGTTDDVRALYEKYPYPSPVVGESLARDVAVMFRWLLRDDDLSGREILDAGCGTGQRLLGVASEYPDARFTGVDMTEASLAVARRLAEKHAIGNVSFERADLLNLDLGRKFDLILSMGGVHVLEEPERGLANLCRHLTDDGAIVLWLYHSLGEAERLLERELLLTLLDDDRSDLEEGRRLLDALGFRLDPRRYGDSNPKAEDASQASIDVDAYLHPIVNAYRFDDALALFERCGLDWAAVNGINLAVSRPGPDGAAQVRYTSKLIDLEGVEAKSLFCLQEAELFDSELLLARYRALDAREKLRILELRTRPTGFTIMAGRGGSHAIFGDRVRGNVVPV